MSLIDEALKRARMEAAQKAAQGEGLPYPTIPRHLGPQRRRAWLVPVLVALAVVAGVVVGLWLASSGGLTAEQLTAERAEVESASAIAPQTATAPAEAVRPETVETTFAAPAAVGPSATTPQPPNAAQAAAVSPTDREAANDQDHPVPDQPEATPALIPAEVTSPLSPSPDSASPPADPAPNVAPAAQPTASAPSPAAAEPPPATTAVTDPDSGVLLVLPERTNSGASDSGTEEVSEDYVQQYPLANGSSIELGGIAWSETGPFALINGRVVGPGSMIEDYTLQRIRPGYVILTGAGRRIRLSLQ